MFPVQHDLFGSPNQTSDWEHIDAPGAEIKIARAFLDTTSAATFFRELHSSIPWKQDQIRVYGKLHDLPRLQRWYGDPGTVYVWSGITMVPEPLTPTLRQLKSMIEQATGTCFNSLLANLYRDGNDTVGWHSDDEPEFGIRPVIASLSLGAPRDFILRHKSRPDIGPITIPLTSGSLLVMSGGTQENWKHTVPRRAAIKTPRINLTLRNSTTQVRKRQK